MSLRRFFIASSFVLSPLAAIGVQSAAFAQSANGSVTLGGTVDSILQIQTTATPAATDLPLSTAGQQAVQIADIVVTQNNSNGVTMTAASTNNGRLVNTANPSDSVSYEIDLVGDGGTAGNFRTLSNFAQGVNGNLDLYIRVNNPSVPKKGSYADTITLTVTDN